MAEDGAVNYYDLLGILPGASTEQIQAAYRVAMKGGHPDSNNGSGKPNADLGEYTRARDVLVNPGLRRDHDGRNDIGPGSRLTMTDARAQLEVARAEARTQAGKVRSLTVRLAGQKDHRSCMDERERAVQAALEDQKHRIEVQVTSYVSDLEQRVSAQAHTLRNVAHERDAARARRQSPASRWVLATIWGLVAASSAVLLVVWTWAVARSARDFAPVAVNWPGWLRQAPVPALTPILVMLAFVGLVVAALVRESSWVLAGPLIALAGLWAVASGAATPFLWDSGAGQITNCLSAYLVLALAGWSGRAVLPD